MFAQKHQVAIITATGGGATGYTDVVRGEIVGLRLVLATGAPLASGSDFTITTEDSGQTVLAQSNVTANFFKVPRQAVHTTTSGAAIANVYAPVHAAGERIKIVVAQGGNTKQGTITVIVA